MCERKGIEMAFEFFKKNRTKNSLRASAIHKVLPTYKEKSRLFRSAVVYCLIMCALFVFAWQFERNPNSRQITESVWGLNIRHYSELIGELSALTHRQLDRELLSDSQSVQVGPPVLAPSTRLFDGSLEVAVRSPEHGSRVHISFDGSVPTPRHPRADRTISINETTVIRAKAFDSSGRPGPTVTASYVLRPPARIPVVSLVLDPVYLDNKHVGIHANPLQRGRAWERPVRLAILSSRSEKRLETEALVRIHGGSSRFNKRKSLRLYVNPEDADLRFWFGSEGNSISASQAEWILRFAGNNHQLHRDRLGRRVARQMGLLVGSEVPCLLYVNGELWGLYDLMERINQQFLSGKVGSGPFAMRNKGLFNPDRRSDPPDFDESRDWNRFYEFVADADVKDSGFFSQIEGFIDVDQFIDYMILAIFSGDLDRPRWNMDLFRENRPDSKWEFLVWDLDGGFGYLGSTAEHDTLAWHLRQEPTQHLKVSGVPDSWNSVRSALVLRRLMENHQFRTTFTNRFLVLLDTILSPEQLNATFDRLLSDYAGTEDIEKLRFSQFPSRSLGPTSYSEQIAQIRNFITERPMYMRQLLQRHLQ